MGSLCPEACTSIRLRNKVSRARERRSWKRWGASFELAKEATVRHNGKTRDPSWSLLKLTVEASEHQERI